VGTWRRSSKPWVFGLSKEAASLDGFGLLELRVKLERTSSDLRFQMFAPNGSELEDLEKSRRSVVRGAFYGLIFSIVTSALLMLVIWFFI